MRINLKIIALFLVTTLVCEQLLYAADSGLKPKQFDLFQKSQTHVHFPDSVASVEEVWKEPSGSGRLVYLIQDAHTNTSGQMNLSKTLDLLFEQEPELKQVFVEAGSGDNSLSFLRQYASLEKRKKVALEYLRKGLLHGEEFLDLTSERDFTLWGVEDMDLYLQAIENYRYTAQKREKYQNYLKRVEQTIHTLKSRVYNPALLAFEEKQSAYLKEELSLTEYLEALSRYAEDLSGYPHLKSLTNLKVLESEIDFKKANQEQQEAIRCLSQEDQKELLELSENDKSPSRMSGSEHRELQGFYALLEEKLRRENEKRKMEGAKTSGALFSSYPNLFKYFSYLRQARKLDAKGVLEEMELFEQSVLKSLSVSDDEKTLLRCQKTLRLLQKLFNLTLTPKEYEEYKAIKQGRGGAETKLFTITEVAGFLNRKIMDLRTYYERASFLEPGYEDILRSSEEFYELTLKRDRAFIENMLKKLKESETIDDRRETIRKDKKNLPSSTKKAVLIAGGFHAPNLKNLLKEKGISYVCITPQVTQETNQKRYEELLLNQKINMAPYAPGQAIASSAHTARLAPAIQSRWFQEISARLAEPHAGNLATAMAGSRLALPDNKEGDYLEIYFIDSNTRREVSRFIPAHDAYLFAYTINQRFSLNERKGVKFNPKDKETLVIKDIFTDVDKELKMSQLDLISQEIIDPLKHTWPSIKKVVVHRNRQISFEKYHLMQAIAYLERMRILLPRYDQEISDVIHRISIQERVISRAIKAQNVITVNDNELKGLSQEVRRLGERVFVNTIKNHNDFSESARHIDFALKKIQERRGSRLSQNMDIHQAADLLSKGLSKPMVYDAAIMTAISSNNFQFHFELRDQGLEDIARKIMIEIRELQGRQPSALQFDLKSGLTVFKISRPGLRPGSNDWAFLITNDNITKFLSSYKGEYPNLKQRTDIPDFDKDTMIAMTSIGLREEAFPGFSGYSRAVRMLREYVVPAMQSQSRYEYQGILFFKVKRSGATIIAIDITDKEIFRGIFYGSRSAEEIDDTDGARMAEEYAFRTISIKLGQNDYEKVHITFSGSTAKGLRRILEVGREKILSRGEYELGLLDGNEWTWIDLKDANSLKNIIDWLKKQNFQGKSLQIKQGYITVSREQFWINLAMDKVREALDSVPEGEADTIEELEKEGRDVRVIGRYNPDRTFPQTLRIVLNSLNRLLEAAKKGTLSDTFENDVQQKIEKLGRVHEAWKKTKKFTNSPLSAAKWYLEQISKQRAGARMAAWDHPLTNALGQMMVSDQVIEIHYFKQDGDDAGRREIGGDTLSYNYSPVTAQRRNEDVGRAVRGFMQRHHLTDPDVLSTAVNTIATGRGTSQHGEPRRIIIHITFQSQSPEVEVQRKSHQHGVNVYGMRQGKSSRGARLVGTPLDGDILKVLTRSEELLYNLGYWRRYGFMFDARVYAVDITDPNNIQYPNKFFTVSNIAMPNGMFPEDFSRALKDAFFKALNDASLGKGGLEVEDVLILSNRTRPEAMYLPESSIARQLKPNENGKFSIVIKYVREDLEEKAPKKTFVEVISSNVAKLVSKMFNEYDYGKLIVWYSPDSGRNYYEILKTDRDSVEVRGFIGSNLEQGLKGISQRYKGYKLSSTKPIRTESYQRNGEYILNVKLDLVFRRSDEGARLALSGADHVAYTERERLARDAGPEVFEKRFRGSRLTAAGLFGRDQALPAAAEHRVDVKPAGARLPQRVVAFVAAVALAVSPSSLQQAHALPLQGAGGTQIYTVARSGNFLTVDGRGVKAVVDLSSNSIRSASRAETSRAGWRQEALEKAVSDVQSVNAMSVSGVEADALSAANLVIDTDAIPSGKQGLGNLVRMLGAVMGPKDRLFLIGDNAAEAAGLVQQLAVKGPERFSTQLPTNLSNPVVLTSQTRLNGLKDRFTGARFATLQRLAGQKVAVFAFAAVGRYARRLAGNLEAARDLYNRMNGYHLSMDEFDRLTSGDPKLTLLYSIKPVTTLLADAARAAYILTRNVLSAA